jgi:hypothetical protein
MKLCYFDLRALLISLNRKQSGFFSILRNFTEWQQIIIDHINLRIFFIKILQYTQFTSIPSENIEWTAGLLGEGNTLWSFTG